MKCASHNFFCRCLDSLQLERLVLLWCLCSHFYCYIIVVVASMHIISMAVCLWEKWIESCGRFPQSCLIRSSGVLLETNRSAESAAPGSDPPRRQALIHHRRCCCFHMMNTIEICRYYLKWRREMGLSTRPGAQLIAMGIWAGSNSRATKSRVHEIHRRRKNILLLLLCSNGTSDHLGNVSCSM